MLQATASGSITTAIGAMLQTLSGSNNISNTTPAHEQNKTKQLMNFFKRKNKPNKQAQKFEEVLIRDNFYQTSSFFPMPVTLISTLSSNGKTNLGAYSLCFPHIISGNHSMILISRGSSNTAQNILRTGKAAINFIPDEKKYMKNCVELGYPGDTIGEKMTKSIFTLIPSFREPAEAYPKLVKESIQIFECSWDNTQVYQINEAEFHFVLKIEKILMQNYWKTALAKGDQFPPIPVDYGFRDGLHFWFSEFSTPYSVDVPSKVPKIFLQKVLQGIVEEALKDDVQLITAVYLNELNARKK